MSNMTYFYDKEDEYTLKKLINSRNENGKIIKDFQDYKIKAYVVRDKINVEANKIEIIDDFRRITALIQYPVKAINLTTNEIEKKLLIQDGDCLIFEDNVYEMSNTELVVDEMKKYYTTNLINYYQPVNYNIIEEEIYTILFKIFEYLQVEAIRFSPFFSTDYFRKIKDKAFLTYVLEQKLENNDFKSIITEKKYNSVKDILENIVVTHRYFDIIINLYDNSQITNIDIALSKNDVFENILEKLNIKLKNIQDLQVVNTRFISNTETMLKDTVLNQKKYITRISLDTVSTFEQDYYDEVVVSEKDKNG